MPKFVTPFNKGRRQSVYGGNETVECGICSQGVQYRNLQNHFNTKHDGATKFVKEHGVKQLSLFSFQKLPTKETQGKSSSAAWYNSMGVNSIRREWLGGGSTFTLNS